MRTRGAFFPYNKSIKQTHLRNMRKIETQMNQAIRNRRNWSGSNTSVVIDDNNEARVYLHGNHIATINDDVIQLFDGGWQSNTTKSRLNAICYEFAYTCGVFQNNWEWFLAGKNGVTHPFVSGMVIA